jgi:hypothetical protein
MLVTSSRIQRFPATTQIKCLSLSRAITDVRGTILEVQGFESPYLHFSKVFKSRASRRRDFVEARFRSHKSLRVRIAIKMRSRPLRRRCRRSQPRVERSGTLVKAKRSPRSEERQNLATGRGLAIWPVACNIRPSQSQFADSPSKRNRSGPGKIKPLNKMLYVKT